MIRTEFSEPTTIDLRLDGARTFIDDIIAVSVDDSETIRLHKEGGYEELGQWIAWRVSGDVIWNFRQSEAERLARHLGSPTRHVDDVLGMLNLELVQSALLEQLYADQRELREIRRARLQQMATELHGE